MATRSDLREWPQTRVEWRIKNFANLSEEVNFCVCSSYFFLSNSKWFMNFYPNGQTKHDSEGYIDLYLCKGTSCENYYVDYTMGIKYYHGSVLKAKKETHKFEMRAYARGFKQLIKRSALSESNAVSPDGTLTIFCSAALVNEATVPTTKEVASQTLYSGSMPLTGHFKDLYLSKRFADVKVIVGGKEFVAHKSVLTSRSTVFYAMFSSGMAEMKSGRVEITDCDPDTFETFLLFLYTGELDMVTPSNAQSLYVTADKYDIQELKAGCIRCMIDDLTTDSFYDVVRLAARYNEPGIFQAATDFFMENAESILGTSKWIAFYAENNSLGNELFIKFYHKYENGK